MAWGFSNNPNQRQPQAYNRTQESTRQNFAYNRQVPQQYRQMPQQQMPQQYRQMPQQASQPQMPQQYRQMPQQASQPQMPQQYRQMPQQASQPQMPQQYRQMPQQTPQQQMPQQYRQMPQQASQPQMPQQYRQMPQQASQPQMPSMDPNVSFEPLSPEVLSLIDSFKEKEKDQSSEQPKEQLNMPDEHKEQPREQSGILSAGEQQFAGQIGNIIQNEYNSLVFYNRLSALAKKGRQQTAILRIADNAKTRIDAFHKLYKEHSDNDYKTSEKNIYNANNLKEGIQLAVREEAQAISDIADLYESCTGETGKSLQIIMFRKISDLGQLLSL